MADFGLSKGLYEAMYFREDRKVGVKLPFKWMAIESLQDGVFSEKTDVVSVVLAVTSVHVCTHLSMINTVLFIALITLIDLKWSFGVTCWEVFSGGKMPYPGVSPLELTRMLCKGQRMDIPDNATCSKEMLVYFITS